MSIETVFKDVMWNLDVVANLNNHQTLYVIGDKLATDTRWLQSWRRQTDERFAVNAALKNSLEVLKQLLQAYQCNIYLSNIVARMEPEQLEIAQTILSQVHRFTEKEQAIMAGFKRFANFWRYVHDAKFVVQVADIEQRLYTLISKYRHFHTCASQRLTKSQTAGAHLSFPALTSPSPLLLRPDMSQSDTNMSPLALAGTPILPAADFSLLFKTPANCSSDEPKNIILKPNNIALRTPKQKLHAGGS
jgi:hypothetical protein